MSAPEVVAGVPRGADDPHEVDAGLRARAPVPHPADALDGGGCVPSTKGVS